MKPSHPGTLVVYFDVTALDDAQFMKLHEEVMLLAREQPAGMFSPGRPQIEMIYGVDDDGLRDVVDRNNAAQQEAYAAGSQCGDPK